MKWKERRDELELEEIRISLELDEVSENRKTKAEFLPEDIVMEHVKRPHFSPLIRWNH